GQTSVFFFLLCSFSKAPHYTSLRKYVLGRADTQLLVNEKEISKKQIGHPISIKLAKLTEYGKQ
ncbi:hypothetical protein, partial [Sphingobacterium sp. 2149]|uniref:hypothetical protein n=1 Tax=Sphingobacterium sp. 2149 TaxID=2817763 RepID=UPI00286BA8FE